MKLIFEHDDLQKQLDGLIEVKGKAIQFWQNSMRDYDFSTDKIRSFFYYDNLICKTRDEMAKLTLIKEHLPKTSIELTIEECKEIGLI
jgi:hypothetical protein